jgi:hypothetical protein
VREEGDRGFESKVFGLWEVIISLRGEGICVGRQRNWMFDVFSM